MKTDWQKKADFLKQTPKNSMFMNIPSTQEKQTSQFLLIPCTSFVSYPEPTNCRKHLSMYGRIPTT